MGILEKQIRKSIFKPNHQKRLSHWSHNLQCSSPRRLSFRPHPSTSRPQLTSLNGSQLRSVQLLQLLKEIHRSRTTSLPSPQQFQLPRWKNNLSNWNAKQLNIKIVVHPASSLRLVPIFQQFYKRRRHLGKCLRNRTNIIILLQWKAQDVPRNINWFPLLSKLRNLWGTIQIWSHFRWQRQTSQLSTPSHA